MVGHQTVGNVVTICRGPSGLRQLDVVLRSKCCWSCIDIHEIDKVKRQLHSNKIDGLLTTGGNIASYHWQKNGSVPGNMRISNDVTFDDVKAWDEKTIEIVPVVLKVMEPVIYHSVHRPLKVQLIVKSVKLEL